MAEASAGLSGVVAGRSAIATVGKGHGLRYRGYAIEELAAGACFEEVAYLLIHGELQASAELDAYRDRLAARRALPDAVRDIMQRLPEHAHPMDVLRTGCSALGCGRSRRGSRRHGGRGRHAAGTAPGRGRRLAPRRGRRRRHGLARRATPWPSSAPGR